MSTLADRLRSPSRRRTSVPIEVSDPGDDVRAAALTARLNVMQLRALRGQDPTSVTEAMLAEAEAEQEKARAALAAHCVVVELQAPPAVEWDRVLTEAAGADEDDTDDPRLASMLALCAVDESLQGPATWAELLGGLAWGDRESLRNAVLDLNTWTPSRALGKG